MFKYIHLYIPSFTIFNALYTVWKQFVFFDNQIYISTTMINHLFIPGQYNFFKITYNGKKSNRMTCIELKQMVTIQVMEARSFSSFGQKRFEFFEAYPQSPIITTSCGWRWWCGDGDWWARYWERKMCSSNQIYQ